MAQASATELISRISYQTGAWTGYCSALVMLPDRKMGVVVLTNGHDHSVGPAIANTVFDHLCGRDEVPWLQRLSDLHDKAVEEQESRRIAWLRSRQQDTRPSHPATDYAGMYEHPAYGKICITAEGERLQLSGLGITLPLMHWHYDVFVTDVDATVWIEGWPVIFRYGDTGRIDRLMIRLEPTLPEIVFFRGGAA